MSRCGLQSQSLLSPEMINHRAIHIFGLVVLFICLPYYILGSQSGGRFVQGRTDYCSKVHVHERIRQYILHVISVEHFQDPCMFSHFQ